MNPFIAELFLIEDIDDFLINNFLNRIEKFYWCASAMSHPITKEQMINYVNDPNSTSYKVLYNNETIGHFNIFANDGKSPEGYNIRVSRFTIYRKHRSKKIQNESYCYWLAKLAFQTCKDKYPEGEKLYGVMYSYDLNEHWSDEKKQKNKNKGIECFKRAGLKEMKRIIKKHSSQKTIMHEKIFFDVI